MKKSSACFSALLAMSLAPSSGSAATGTMNFPLSAQKAFQTALSGLDASGWPAAAAATSVAQPMPTMAAPPKADPVPPEEWIARLVKLMRSFTSVGSLSKKSCLVLNLCDGTADMPLKTALAETSTDGAQHAFGIPTKADSKDLLIMRITPTLVETFLIDKTGKLRAAAVQTADGARLITNEKAAEQFKKEMELFGKEASELPPTGTSVAVNN